MHSAPPRPPSIDRVINWTAIAPLIAEYGREPVLSCTRALLDSARQAARNGELADYTEPALATRLEVGTTNRTHADRPAGACRLAGRRDRRAGTVAVRQRSLPVDRLDGWALAVRPTTRKTGVLHDIEAALRGLPVQVIGRIADGALRLDRAVCPLQTKRLLWASSPNWPM